MTRATDPWTGDAEPFRPRRLQRTDARPSPYRSRSRAKARPAALVLAAALVAALLPAWSASAAASPAAERPIGGAQAGDLGRCFAHPAGTVFDGDNLSRSDAVAARADIVEFCIRYDADDLQLSVRVADPVDPTQDANWRSPMTGIDWALNTTGEQFGPVTFQAEYYLHTVAGGNVTRTFLSSPGHPACEGLAAFTGEHHVSVFAADCLRDAPSVGVSLNTIYDTNPDDEANASLRIDRAPEGQDGFSEAVARAGEPGTGPGEGPACRDRDGGSGAGDVGGNFHERAIDCLVSYGITQGTSPTTYSPGAGVRRDQMATFLGRLIETAGVALPDPTDQGFADIAGNTHADRINQLAEIGVLQGTSPTAYSPRGAVRRDQMASFLVRAFEFIDGQALPPAPPRFGDTANNVHAGNIDKAAAAGFAQGTTPETYSPRPTVRRDQMASFLTRVLDRLVTDGRDLS